MTVKIVLSNVNYTNLDIEVLLYHMKATQIQSFILTFFKLEQRK